MTEADLLIQLENPDTYWYLATPYSKYPAGMDEAARLAAVAAAWFVKHGIPVFSPIVHTHPIAQHGGINPADHTIWLPADEIFMDLASGLVVVQMETWDTAYGVGVERKLFASQGKPEILIPWSVFGGSDA